MEDLLFSMNTDHLYHQSKIKSTAQEILDLIATKGFQLHEAMAAIKAARRKLREENGKQNDS